MWPSHLINAQPSAPLNPPCLSCLYRYWYPLTYFLSLALQPTALIGLESSLQMPKFQVTCESKPSVFAYPTPVNVEKKEEVSVILAMHALCQAPLTRIPAVQSLGVHLNPLYGHRCPRCPLPS